MPVPGDFHLRLATRALRAGGVVACPTEAVFGLGCDPFDRDAVYRLLALKRRPVAKGLIVVASSPLQVAGLLAPLTAAQRDTLYASWPGPNTWVLPNRELFPAWVTGGKDTVAVRVSGHPVVRALCEAFGGALVSTSANLSGHAPARTALAVRAQFGDMIDCLVPGALGELARPTQIRDLATGRVLRPS